MRFFEDMMRHIKGGSRLLDVTSMGLSGLCLAHCLVLPFVVSGLPFIGDIAHTEWLHQTLVCLAVPLTAWTLYRSEAYRKWNIVLFAGIGLALLTVAAFYEPAQRDEVFISVVGAIYVAMAHLINYLEHAYTHKSGVPHTCH